MARLYYHHCSCHFSMIAQMLKTNKIYWGKRKCQRDNKVLARGKRGTDWQRNGRRGIEPVLWIGRQGACLEPAPLSWPSPPVNWWAEGWQRLESNRPLTRFPVTNQSLANMGLGNFRKPCKCNVGLFLGRHKKTEHSFFSSKYSVEKYLRFLAMTKHNATTSI